MQRRVRATVQGGFFPSRQDMLARVCTLAGVSERAITEADVTALSRDGGKMEQLLSEIVAGKAPRGSQSGSKQSAADKTVPGASVCSSKADLVLDQVIESVPQEIRRLPVPLMRLWTDADGFDLADLTMPWDLFADSVGCMPMLEGLEDWYDTSLGSPELSEFLETFVKPRLAPDGIISVVRLHVTAKKVQHMLSVPKDKVDLKACLEFIHRLDVQKNVAPRPRRTAALSTGIADGLMSRSDSCTVSTGGHVLGRVIPLGAVGEALEELRRELQPFEFVDDTYERMAHFCPGTRAWIKGEVFAWANDPSSKPMLALLAPPGFG